MDAKTFYEQLAPELDPGGFKLYFTAQRLTGFELYKQFPYTKTSCAKKCHAENSSQNVLIHTIGVVLTTENYCGSIIA